MKIKWDAPDSTKNAVYAVLLVIAVIAFILITNWLQGSFPGFWESLY